MFYPKHTFLSVAKKLEYGLRKGVIQLEGKDIDVVKYIQQSPINDELQKSPRRKDAKEYDINNNRGHAKATSKRNKIGELIMVDLDGIRDPEQHDLENVRKEDEELINSWVSRKLRNKKTWQMEREINRRGIMHLCLKRLDEVKSGKIAKKRHTGDKLVFVSHKEEDVESAELLINVILSSLDIKEDQVRCTSVSGHQLDFGRKISEQLRSDISLSTAVFALLTTQSLKSNWVLFELGASWVFGKLLIPILEVGLSYEALPGPLKEYPCISIENDDANQRLCDALRQVGETLEIDFSLSARTRRDLDAFITRFRGNLT